MESLATSAHEMSDHNMSQQQQSAVSPVSPLRPAPIPSSQMLPLAVSNYYSTPPSLLQHHQQEKLKLASHGASGNGLGLAKSNEHKSNDQVITEQAREILRQAVVSATSGGFGENAVGGGGGGGMKSGAANAPKGENAKSKGAVRYRECQKNHAASIGGHAMDGCGEFMPSGGDDDYDALRCAACDCHRNFHRREVEGDAVCDCKLRKAKPGHGSPLRPTALATQPGPERLALTAGPNQMTPLAMAAAMSAGGPTDSDELDDGPGNIVTSAGGAMHMSMRSPASAIKKRFRTKFTTDQKDKMCAFAEKVGWRIQKHDEAAVQEFCAVAGVKRHVLKVWMHNNKHTMGKKP